MAFFSKIWTSVGTSILATTSFGVLSCSASGKLLKDGCGHVGDGVQSDAVDGRLSALQYSWVVVKSHD
jgi:hypothetical protein